MSTKVSTSLLKSSSADLGKFLISDGSTLNWTSSALIVPSIDITQTYTISGDAGKLLTSNGSTLSWVASSVLGGGGVASYTNNYLRLTSGLLVQWGSASTDANGAATVVFPYAYTSSSKYGLNITGRGTSTGGYSTGGTMTNITAKNAGNFSVQMWASYTTDTNSIRDFVWTSVGHIL